MRTAAEIAMVVRICVVLFGRKIDELITITLKKKVLAYLNKNCLFESFSG
jgi:hypothetical protein